MVDVIQITPLRGLDCKSFLGKQVRKRPEVGRLKRALFSMVEMPQQIRERRQGRSFGRMLPGFLISSGPCTELPLRMESSCFG
jgi:hypothetical protein